MLERFKASFTRRDAQQEKLLPGYGLSYFDNLYGEYRSLPAERVIPEVKAIVDEILMTKQNASLTWDDLYTFDLLLARLQPPEKLARKVWHLRSRYRDVAGLREYEAYLASKPPDLAGRAEELDLRAHIEYLLRELHLRYAIRPFREKTRVLGLEWHVCDITKGTQYDPSRPRTGAYRRDPARDAMVVEELKKLRLFEER